MKERDLALKTTMIHFNERLRNHCSMQCINDCPNCATCCMRLYCFTAPCARTDDMMYNSIRFLDHLDCGIDDTGKDNHVHLDHYMIYEPIEPGPLDMMNAPRFLEDLEQ